VDYLHPVEALIPGARGRVLAALVANTSAQTIRQVALRAGVSPSRTGQVLDDLAELGVVERRELAGGHVLVRLMPASAAGKLFVEAGSLWSAAVEAMREEASSIEPAPVTLTVFGSFARGQARRDSDVDGVAVHADANEGTERGERWAETSAAWVDAAGRITGNPVNLIDLDIDELGGELPEWLASAARDGLVLAGIPVPTLIGRLVGRSGR
jgi:predicted nucleotidyltransferase